MLLIRKFLVTSSFFGFGPWIVAVAIAGLSAADALAFGSKRKTAESSTANRSESDPSLKSLAEISRHSGSGLDAEPEDFRLWIEQRAKLFARFKRNEASVEEKTLFSSECEMPANRNPYCRYIESADPRKSGSSKGRERRNRRLSQVRKWISRGEIEQLTQLRERDLREGLQAYNSLSKLETAIAKATEHPDCEAAMVRVALGAKAEEFFPAEVAIKSSVTLYEKAAVCGNSEHAERARYRLSLIHVWNGACEKALPHLEILAQPVKSKDYRIRALFWTAECGTRLGQAEMAQKARDSLFADFPFSLHSLLAQREPEKRLNTKDLPADSEIRFRSASMPEANDFAMAIEGLLAIKENRLAQRVLANLPSEIDHAEPEFQLYLALLLNRAEDYIGKFRILTPLFRDHARLISRASLELYYPKRELNTVAVQQVGLNELLVLSLIRQESAFQEKARSVAGAIGLMQVMPGTARRIERKRNYNLYDPNHNVRIGSKYFAGLLQKYGGDTELALAAYNAGPKRVEDWVRRYPVSERLLFLDLIPFRETREYVASIARNYYWYSLLYGDPVAGTDSGAEGQKLGRIFKLFGGPGF